MMKKFMLNASLSLSLLLSANGVLAAPELNKPAPQFAVQGSDGKTHSLSDYKGKFVVLEWWNKDCPYVKKHYDSKNMQSLQEAYTKKSDVVWFTVLSSAPGKQGHLSAEEANKVLQASGAKPTTVLLDPKGEMGRAYEAKTTPHMFVINKEGTLIYMGGIDDKPTTDKSDIAAAKPYVKIAMDQALAGKPVTDGSTKPYGCSVKY